MRIVRQCCAAVVSSLLFVCSQTAFAQWKWVNPLPTGSPLTALTWDGSQFVGFDNSDAILTSPDGVGWDSVPSGRTESVSTLVWGNGTYVAAGFDSGLATVLTSTDGLTWTPHEIGVPVNFFSQALWNADLHQFVLTADSGVILTSSNGADWAPQASGTLNDLDGIAWGGGQYVVVGAHGTVLTSSNGVDWADHSLAGADQPLVSVAANGNLFAIVTASSFGLDDHSTIITNSDPSDPAGWKVAFGVVDPSTRSQLARIVWDGASFVAIGGIIATSPDGDVWTYVASGVADILRTVAFGDNEIVVADSSGDLLVSPLDGQGWLLSSSNIVTEDIEGVLWNGSYFGAVTDFGSFLSSTDGVNWQVNNFALPIAASAVAWANGTLVAVGDGGIASSADDGFTWDPSPNPDLSGVAFDAVTWGNGQFVAVGEIFVPDPPHLLLALGVIFTSPDGTSWTAQASNAIPGDSIRAVTWAGDRFVAVGGTSFHAVDGDLRFGPPVVFTSPDGLTWTRATPFDPLLGGRSLSSIAWSGSQFVAVGTPGFGSDERAIATSSDGTTWEYVFPLPAEVGVQGGGILQSVTWTGTQFVTIGTSSAELTSPDGHNWTAHATGAAGLNAVAASGTQCIAVGDFGSIMREETLCNADPLFKSGFD